MNDHVSDKKRQRETEREKGKGRRERERKVGRTKKDIIIEKRTANASLILL